MPFYLSYKLHGKSVWDLLYLYRKDQSQPENNWTSKEVFPKNPPKQDRAWEE